MARSASDDASELIGVGLFLLAAAVVDGIVAWRQMEQEKQEQEVMMVLDYLLNDQTGNVLGDSDLSFRYQDSQSTSPDEIETFESILAEAEHGG